MPSPSRVTSPLLLYSCSSSWILPLSSTGTYRPNRSIICCPPLRHVEGQATLDPWKEQPLALASHEGPPTMPKTLTPRHSTVTHVSQLSKCPRIIVAAPRITRISSLVELTHLPRILDILWSRKQFVWSMIVCSNCLCLNCLLPAHPILAAQRKITSFPSHQHVLAFSA